LGLDPEARYSTICALDVMALGFEAVGADIGGRLVP